jgi:group I intron endonuclease
MFVIYKIINTVTGYCYIGCSKNIKNRWREHKRHLQQGRHHNVHLQRAWDKYQEESFTWEIILECDSENMMFLEEKQLIENTVNLYNIAEGGLGGNYTKNWDKNRKEQHRVECSNRTIERYKDPEERKKANCFKGLTQEERDQRVKIWSEAKLGSKNNKYKYDKPVLQIDRSTGEVIKEWKDVCEASYAGFERRYVISCCKEKKGYNSHKGFIWRWKN